MKICLAGLGGSEGIKEHILSHPPKYVLESFYYFKDWQVSLIKSAELFLLDSGAFTFMHSTKTVKTDFDEYLDRYIAFINKNDIEYFFELDVDSVVGYDTVKQMRNRLDRETGKQCISVWHISRGYDDFIEQTQERPYVALGGIAGKKANSKEYKRYEKAFPYLIRTAHKNGAKIHGLGYTNPKGLKEKNRFDSVDSTSWLSGMRYGMIYNFRDGEMEYAYKTRKNGKRFKKSSTNEINLHNLEQWMKFQEYAEVYL